MCFSAEASFIGAAALTVIGTATLKTQMGSQNKLWAMIPLLFAFQQFCEGIVWLDLRGTLPHSAFTVLAKDLYLFFALALWLIWMPLALLVAEPDPKLKIALRTLLFLGITTAILNLNIYSILELSPTVNKYSVNYQTEGDLYKRLFYLAIVALPAFISSLKYMKVFGLLIIISCVTAEYFYATTFTSVWCFLASFISAALFLISRANVTLPLSQSINTTIENNNKNLIHK